ncbi:MAG: hypothetical protein LUH82_00845 [Clostridiales bacterium]|nr:hypothetical protein [Clostridiales bacterium]
MAKLYRLPQAATAQKAHKNTAVQNNSTAVINILSNAVGYKNLFLISLEKL